MALKKIWKHTAIGVGTFQTVSMTSVRNWVVSSMSHTTARPVPPEGWTSDLHCWQPHDNTMYKQCRSHTVLTSHSCIQTTDMQTWCKCSEAAFLAASKIFYSASTGIHDELHAAEVRRQKCTTEIW